MQKETSGGINKILAAVLIGIMLILMIGIVVSGWQTDSSRENNGEGGILTENADNLNGDTDKESGTADNFINTENTYPKPPQYVNYLTGLATEEAYQNRAPYSFVIDPNFTSYGISGSELTIEVQTENGNTRFLNFKTNITDLGKLGAFCATRDYITQLSKMFGGVLVSYGEDDIISYPSLSSKIDIDLTKHNDVIFKENGKSTYTNGESVSKITKDDGIDIITYKRPSLPYDFADFGSKITGTTSAECVYIPYSNENKTSFVYNTADNSYTLYKNERIKVDMLNGQNVSYTNVFVLFADVVTYETASGTETIVNTATEGTGYYISSGTLTEIKWSVDSSNNLIFKNLNGNKLVVNRGNSFIGYYKASASQDVTFQ